MNLLNSSVLDQLVSLISWHVLGREPAFRVSMLFFPCGWRKRQTVSSSVPAAEYSCHDRSRGHDALRMTARTSHNNFHRLMFTVEPTWHLIYVKYTFVRWGFFTRSYFSNTMDNSLKYDCTSSGLEAMARAIPKELGLTKRISSPLLKRVTIFNSFYQQFSM